MLGNPVLPAHQLSLVVSVTGGPQHQQVLPGKHPSEPDTGVIRVEGGKGPEWLSHRAHYTQSCCQKGRAEQSWLCLLVVAQQRQFCF